VGISNSISFKDMKKYFTGEIVFKSIPPALCLSYKPQEYVEIIPIHTFIMWSGLSNIGNNYMINI
jgi:hypothetical protein